MQDCDVIFEPFGGSAAYSLSQDLPFYFSDSQPELVNFMEQVRDQPVKLIEGIKSLEVEVISGEDWNTLRMADRQDLYLEESATFRAARYYYLLSTSFSNLYRVNLKGQANMPWAKGQKKLPNDYQERIREASAKFKLHCKGIRLGQFDDLDVLEYVIDLGHKPFLLIDPPYYGTYDQYVKDRPKPEFWTRLRKFVDVLVEKEIPFLLTNSYDPFILDLFKDLEIKQVPIRYTTAQSGEKRVISSEAFITNKGIKNV